MGVWLRNLQRELSYVTTDQEFTDTFGISIRDLAEKAAKAA